jgi:hypothetical protein
VKLNWYRNQKESKENSSMPCESNKKSLIPEPWVQNVRLSGSRRDKGQQSTPLMSSFPKTYFKTEEIVKLGVC